MNKQDKKFFDNCHHKVNVNETIKWLNSKIKHSVLEIPAVKPTVKSVNKPIDKPIDKLPDPIIETIQDINETKYSNKSKRKNRNRTRNSDTVLIEQE